MGDLPYEDQKKVVEEVFLTHLGEVEREVEY